jgi:nitroreductase
MKRRAFLKGVPAVAVLAAAAPLAAAGAVKAPASSSDAAPTAAGDLQPIALAKPQTDGGKSVLAALQARRTIREISAEKLSPQTLSNLLWAAWGVNREKGPFGQIGRTAASASNSQEIDLYVVLPEGIYLYEAEPHRLAPVAEGDHRAKVGGRGRAGGAAQAPVSLVFVADVARFAKAKLQEPGLKDPEIQKSYYNVATGLIAGNVYLFAASQGLAAWFHNCDKPALAAVLKLGVDQRALYAQTVGVPAGG